MNIKLNNNDISKVSSIYKIDKKDLSISKDERGIPVIKSLDYYFYIFREGTFIPTFMDVYNNDINKVDSTLLKVMNGDKGFEDVLDDVFKYFSNNSKTTIYTGNNFSIYKREIKK